MKAPLPVRDGIGPSRVRLPPGPWRTALEFFVARFTGIGEAAWRSRLRRGLVVDARGVPLGESAPYAPGATLWYYRELDAEPPIPFEAEVLHRDAHLLVADKPHFLPVLPAGRYLQETLLVRLKKTLGLDALAPLHRIDRGTAGLVVFSVNPQTRAAYQRLFAERALDKRYEALAPLVDGLEFPFTRRSRLVRGEPFHRMREVDGAPNSETVFESVERRGARGLYRLRPLSGRKHQLRVHMAALGAPIDNDPLYPELRSEADGDYARPLKLLARSLAFRDPLSGEPRRFESRREL